MILKYYFKNLQQYFWIQFSVKNNHPQKQLTSSESQCGVGCLEIKHIVIHANITYKHIPHSIRLPCPHLYPWPSTQRRCLAHPAAGPETGYAKLISSSLRVHHLLCCWKWTTNCIHPHTMPPIKSWPLVSPLLQDTWCAHNTSLLPAQMLLLQCPCIFASSQTK